MTGRDGSGLEDLWYSDAAAAALGRAALRPLSSVFAAGVAIRGALYDRGLLSAARAPAPVVSVGGLSVGGSGKTPMVLWLAARLREAGHRPCIVTRGYGGESREPFLLGAGAAGDAGAVRRAGDEAVLLALRSASPVAVGADRLRACRFAAAGLAGSREAPDVFLLDDGFQHRRLARDVDVVLVSGRESGQRLLPAGPLRESVAALARADAVVEMSREGDAPASAGREGPPTIAEHASPMAKPRVRAATSATCLVTAVTDTEGEATSTLAGRSVVAVAAIARPQRFLADLEAAGARIVAKVIRRDHHRYDEADRRAIDAAAVRADLVVTTEKDLVKLTHGALSAPLQALRIDVRMASAADEDRLLGCVRTAFDR